MQSITPEISDASIRNALSIVFNLLPLGALAVTTAGTILAVNAAAQEIIALNDGLQLQGDILTAASPYHARYLRQALRSASQPDQSPTAFTIPRVNHAPLKAALFRVASASSAPVILMLLLDSDMNYLPDENLLRKMFTLTHTESKVAALLMCGKSIEDISAELGICDSTARNHLKRIFAKTGTRRQGELVSILLRSPARFATTQIIVKPRQ